MEQVNESVIKNLVREGIRETIKLIRESQADYEWERMMDMRDRYEEEDYYAKQGGEEEVDYWASRGWLSPKQQVFYKFGFLKDVHRKPVVPLLDDEGLEKAIARAEQMKAAYEKDASVNPGKVKALNYIYNCLMDQKNFPDKYEQAKSEQFYNNEREAIKNQQAQANYDYNKRTGSLRVVSPETRKEIMNTNPGRFVNRPAIPNKSWFTPRMRQGEKEMMKDFGKQSWFPGNMDAGK